MTPREYAIRSCVEGIRSHTNVQKSKNLRSIKDDSEREELCSALACQCSTFRNVEWVQCSNADCKRWYHIICAGIVKKKELPERWCCGIETSEDDSSGNYFPNGISL